jgi:FKBP-type peptidyl-prolyl cis-trans isomerase
MIPLKKRLSNLRLLLKKTQNYYNKIHSLMKKTSILIAGLALLFAIGGCARGGGFKRTKSGLLYKIISTDEKNPIAKKGEFLKVHYTNKVGDSVLSTSVGALPTYAPVDSVGPVYNALEVFPKLRKGDSAVIVMLADSLEKKQGPLPPFIKKKDKVTLTLKVLDVLKTEQDVRNDQQALIDKKKVDEVKDIEKYLADKKINAQKTEKGVFVEIDQQGAGPKVDSGKTVSVMYKGQTFEGKVFDTNKDTAISKRTEPFTFTIGQHGAIEGWDDGLRLFNEGGKGKLYIPSMLAYGPNPPQGAPFKPFENLMFEVEVVKVENAKPAPARPQMMPPQGGRPGGQ